MEQENNPSESINKIKSTREPKQNNFLISLLSILLLISVFIAGFFAYQTQRLVKELTVYRLQPTQTPSLSPTTDSTANWKTYINEEYGFSLKYPYNYEMVNDNNSIISFGFKNPADETPFSYLKIYNDHQSKEPQNSNDIKIDGIDAKKFDLHKGVDRDYQIVQISKPKIELEMVVSGGGLDRDFDQILSTFKFIEPTSSSSPIACTMDAKVCPDGSAVGRSGPKCEFAPCPITKPVVSTSPQP